MDRIDTNNVEVIALENICANEYPEFSSAQVKKAKWKNSGKQLTGEEIDFLNKEYIKFVQQQAYYNFVADF